MGENFHAASSIHKYYYKSNASLNTGTNPIDFCNGFRGNDIFKPLKDEIETIRNSGDYHNYWSTITYKKLTGVGNVILMDRDEHFNYPARVDRKEIRKAKLLDAPDYEDFFTSIEDGKRISLDGVVDKGKRLSLQEKIHKLMEAHEDQMLSKRVYENSSTESKDERSFEDDDKKKKKEKRKELTENNAAEIPALTSLDFENLLDQAELQISRAENPDEDEEDDADMAVEDVNLKPLLKYHKSHHSPGARYFKAFLRNILIYDLAMGRINPKRALNELMMIKEEKESQFTTDMVDIPSDICDKFLPIEINKVYDYINNNSSV